jgi:glycosyltransferase 2 family protein
MTSAHATAGAVSARASWKRGMIRIAGSLTVLALLFLILPVDELWAALRQVPAAVWVGTVAVYMALHLLGVVKWRLLVNAAGAGLPAVHAVRCYYIGLFSNTFLPSVVGGDVVRAGVAMRRVRSREGLVLGSLVDRIQDVLGLAAVAAIGALLLPTALDERSRRVFWVLAAVAAVGGATVLLLVWLLPGRRLPFRLRRRLAAVRTAFRALSRRPGRMAGAFLLGMLLQTSQVVLNMWLGGLVGVHAPLQVWLFVWPLAKIAATLPLTQGGIGVREAALATLFAPFGVAAVNAVAVSLVFQVIIISGGFIGGGLAFVLGGRHEDSPATVRTAPRRRAVAAPRS